MNCIYCNHPQTKVIECASSKTSGIRKRQCVSCHQTYLTEELYWDNQSELRSMLTHLREESRRKNRTL